MPTFKPAYLITGEDHGRVAERRAKLRERAERESGAGGVEVLEGDAAAPDLVAAALMAMTFAIGRRFVIVDGVERWKDSDVADHVGPALATLADDTTVAFFAREDGRAKAPAKLAEAVKKAGGDVSAEATLKPRELPKWLREEARKLDIDLDGAAAQALVAHVGERQQRLLRELEKLALEHGPGAVIGLEEGQESCATSAERKVWTLPDALVAGDRRTSIELLLELRQQGERVGGLIYNMVRRLRDAVAIAEALQAG